LRAFTAPWQPPESDATFFFRHCSASAPPGVTPRHFDMKSERQLARSASCWAWLGCASTGVRTASMRAKAAVKEAATMAATGLAVLMGVLPHRPVGRFLWQKDLTPSRDLSLAKIDSI
jgi:hypothetical protein